ncbi:MAG: 50S ribosomal protein L9 [Candidatus Yanofskybacteria bacterium RIFOXYD1_FULL_44_17]|nr:MAG: 50S ribosomal protein L9 [Candidatus Yanofskybacteria bacterium RIFOXYA2_FULL_45_28]OGN37011.1 MAG: 50S ribosomal protein L9 [Candidatus Yanofskybacteria bacterium RIFOXYA1_FULL_44_17]OGN38453.1 MAG: 50S ribosomal protein L9 [Candidatus Yanofskybacteria bacterium RIFOXYC1_FULL_44_16]OGN38631.1 MAG: 50S ribosomal protein L9 [Candidatus Yanofskybacteria bacterium RIFOXYB2_FULL_44_18]OGN38873.1 MAG: 50S ribosomal protein L9 [Candidatus Yanofskybacteria bacterium RIFOXYB1_FULL_44_29]OGN400
MKVILLENIKGYGLIGDVKNVADGYAKNFLFPKKWAKPATSGTAKEIENLRKKATIMVEIERKNAEGVAEQMKTLVTEIVRKANDGGTLFDGIDKIDIVEAVKVATRIELEEDMITLEDKIKKVGEYIVPVELMKDIKTELKVIVKAE